MRQHTVAERNAHGYAKIAFYAGENTDENIIAIKGSLWPTLDNF